MFALPAGDLFGGREDNAESDKPEPSGFDFVQNGVTDVATESASAFSFLQSPSSPMEEAEESREHAPADAVGGSAFDFMQQPVEEEGAGSSFAFMAAEKVLQRIADSAGRA